MKKPLTTNDRKKNIINSLNDKENPYSLCWTNHILKINYNSGITVKGFQNGVPQFKISKLKEEFSLPPIYSTAYQTKFGKFGFKTLSTFSNNYGNKSMSSFSKKNKTHYEKFYEHGKDENYNINNNNINYYYNNENNNNNENNVNNINENNNYENNNQIQFNVILSQFDKGKGNENNDDIKNENDELKKSNNSSKVIFNNYDGNYDVRNEKDYEKIKKQYEEQNLNMNNKPKKIESQLDEINENDEDI